MYADGRYRELNPTWHEEDAREKAAAIAEMIRFGGLFPRTVADVGCGTGQVLRELKRLLDEGGQTDIIYEGWDVAGGAIAQARAREGGRLSYTAGDFLSSERRVDLVLCVDTFEHVGDDVAFLSGLRERADDFVFRIPLDLSALDVLRPKRILAARRQWGHRHLYSRAVALEVLREAGFQVRSERYHRVGGPYGGLDPLRRTLFRASPHRAVRLLGGYSLLVLASR